MTSIGPTPLQRAFDRLAEVLPTREVARRWYEGYLAALGPRAVVDTFNGGTLADVHRRAAGSQDVLPLATVQWRDQQMGPRLLDGLLVRDGRQMLRLLYDADGSIGDRAMDERWPGRLVELARVLRGASDGVAASVAFVASLGDEQHGPGRVHYPVAVPGGVEVAWAVGLRGCRRALHDGRVPDEARFVVADGLEGAAVGWGTTRAEAEAAYAARVAEALPERRPTVESAADDYDDDGNLIARGPTPPDELEPGPPGAASTILKPEPGEGEEWKSGEQEGHGYAPPTIEGAPGRIRIDLGTFFLRGPSSDAPTPPRRAELVPHVVIALDPVLEAPRARGRWTRLLGATGVTRHALRIEERDGHLLVGSDVLSLVDVKRVRADLDAADARVPDFPGPADYERFVRYRARQYRWSPATAQRPEGWTFAGGSAGPRFDAGGLDGDEVQGMVVRHRRVRRPA